MRQNRLVPFQGGGAAGIRRRVPSFVCFAAASLFAGIGVRAQEPATGETPPPANAEAPAAPQSQAPAQLGRVVGDNVALRCWPSTVAAPPVFEDVLAKDTVVGIGRSENGFREIVTPFGPIGYVSRKFAVADADGKVKTKGSKVAFRYRPKSSEAPVTMLEEGTELQVVEEQEDWYRCRVAGIEAWVAESDVQAVDGGDAAVQAAHAEWQQKQKAEIAARLDRIAADKARAAQDELDLQQVKVVEQAFAQELTKPVAEQKFEPLDQALDKLLGEVAQESTARPAITALKERIDRQRWIAEAAAVVNRKPEPVPQPPPEPQDELARLQGIGWLRYERRLGSPGIYYLEKGGRRQCMVSCNTGRYDLALFVDREVGIAGPRRHPATETLTVLDAERLEVLGSTR